MTKRERILAAIEGRPVDRLPYSLWYHFRLDPPAGPDMAEAELNFYHKYDPDLLKVMHDIPYEMPDDLPIVKSIEDWERLPVLDGVSGNFGKQLATLKMIRDGMGDDGIIVDTIFGAYATAEKVCEKRTLEFLRQNPEAVHKGLKKIAASLSNYARALVDAGIDGAYLAISGAASDTMPAEEYQKNFLAYDQQVLNAASNARFNVVHHHGAGVYPELVLGLKNYAIYSWSGQIQGNIGLKEMRLKTTSCLMCGVDETTFGAVSPQNIMDQIKKAIADTQGHRFIVGPGCAVPTPPACTEANLKAFRQAIVGD
jgi:uroporphyrinogen decarboxylase